MKLRILIADDESPARYAMAKALKHLDYEIAEAEDGEKAIQHLQRHGADLVFLDLTMPTVDGKGVLREVQNMTGSTEFIVVTADESVSTAVECIRLGASDYIAKPYEVEQLRAIARRACKRVVLEERLERLQNELDQKQAFGALVGASQPMRDLFYQMQRAAQAPVDVLIRGDTGTGKELIAREIHRLGPRSQGPFIAVNTAAIAESLAESELFGHVRGAFTGADSDRVGVFEQADGGTLFLDEIGDMPLPTQTKILRALQERVVQRVGTTTETPVDVRIITATHQDLAKAISDGNFREDLFYRLNGIELRVPPLRQRREDIMVLANYFLKRISDRLEVTPRLESRAIDKMLTYRWPGNVRELEHTITAGAAMAEDGVIRLENLPWHEQEAEETELDFGNLMDLPLTEAKSRLIESFERRMIQLALRNHQGNVSAAARQLGIHRQSLQQKMTQLCIRAEQAR